MATFEESQIIVKLNSSNYLNWKFKLEMLLIKEELFEVISEDPPTLVNTDWQRKDRKAKAQINVIFEDAKIVHVKNLTTAKETWDTLKNTHERANYAK